MQLFVRRQTTKRLCLIVSLLWGLPLLLRSILRKESASVPTTMGIIMSWRHVLNSRLSGLASKRQNYSKYQGSEPIPKMDNSFLDNAVSSDHNQLAQSSSQVRLDSLEVPSNPISDNTNVDEIDHEIVSLDPTLDDTNLDETNHPQFNDIFYPSSHMVANSKLLAQYPIPWTYRHKQSTLMVENQ
ncbi:hypothetical protein JHK87_006710 [Glycine soja]|nr:hypothetical protein JHK87_006710 [Glycine soja]